ncbi:DUF5753 domain-containing protein [Nocardia asiatica]|uniref:DUF5753 domain-containing protein n=1 Tax=Nocardia asiatica TaxID=209252 RepID=UPI0024567ECF|nr:DUF5753 domain-containing protein [Nocardia asiatica]
MVAVAKTAGKSSLQRVEKGQNQKIRTRDLDGLIEIYGIDAHRAAGLKGLAQQAAEKSWWHEFGDVIPSSFSVYMGLESAAHKLISYQPDLIPGLLQTARYARVLARTANPEDAEAEVDSRVRLKKQRQTFLTRRTKPIQLEVVLHEGALRRVIGSREIMAEQLRYLADESTRLNVRLRVLPFTAGMPTGDQIGPFVILEFGHDSLGNPVEPTIVYAENYTGDMYSEKTDIVQRYAQAYALIEQAALGEGASRDKLRLVAREHESER